MGVRIRHEKHLWSIFTVPTQIRLNRFFCNLKLETSIENHHENQNFVKTGQKYQAPKYIYTVDSKAKYSAAQ